MFLIEIIALIFLCRKNGQLALQKGLKPRNWKFYTVAAWIVAEFIGCIIGLMLFVKSIPTDPKQLGEADILTISMVALFAAFGGYLFVRHTLENKPDAIENDINEIGIDDLRPPKR